MFDNKPLQSASNAAKDVVLANLQGTTCLEILAALRKIDTHGILDRGREGRGRHLADLLHHLFNTLKLKPNEFTLYEVGAHHHSLFRTHSGPYDPGIAQFHALHKENLPYNYFAFEPNSNPEQIMCWLDNDMQLYLGYGPWSSKNYRPDNDFFAKLINAIGSITVPSFEKLKEAAEKTDTKKKIPVFFSNHVFNDSDMDSKFDFWKLPGIHFHRVYFHEGCSVYGSGYRDEPGYILQNFLNNPQKHLAHFRSTFGLNTKGISCIFLQNSDELIYYWKGISDDEMLNHIFAESVKKFFAK